MAKTRNIFSPGGITFFFSIFLILMVPLVVLSANVTIVHSCDNWGHVIPCG